ncbi:MAG: manganese efflux pump, partial [Lachnospiraceae bacterium]|nr:manganese efflux pump [Lachnospiraceae bacterium]
LAIGKRAGLKLQARASILGGLLLLAIGIEIFLGDVF